MFAVTHPLKTITNIHLKPHDYNYRQRRDAKRLEKYQRERERQDAKAVEAAAKSGTEIAMDLLQSEPIETVNASEMMQKMKE